MKYTRTHVLHVYTHECHVIILYMYLDVVHMYDVCNIISELHVHVLLFYDLFSCIHMHASLYMYKYNILELY